jgi:hypothetical protein
MALIKSNKNVSQIRNFESLKMGKIHPTDIDMCIEYQDKVYIFAETKYGDVKLPVGQRLAFARITDNLWKRDKLAMFCITTHNTPTDQQIDMGKTEVVEYRFRGRWVKPIKTISLREAIMKLTDKIVWD